MSDYTISVPIKRYERHPKLAALKGLEIGPVQWIIPDPEHKIGMRGQVSKKTKNANWMKYRAKRKVRNKIAHVSRMRNT